MQSFWANDMPIRTKENKFVKETEVAIIGGGIAGLLTAYKLKNLGIDSVVIEADRICGGVTLNTTAKITVQHGMIFKRLIDDFGLENAKKYVKANAIALEEYRKIILSNSIDCDYNETDSYVYSTQSSFKMKLETEAAKRCGLEAYFTKHTELPFKVDGAVVVKNQAQFNPVRFLSHISSNLNVIENTRAISVEGNRIETDKGDIIATNIVFATHYPFINFPGYFFAKMHQERSHFVALNNAQKIFGMYVSAENGFSFRGYEDKLIFGGAKHRTGKTSGKFAAVEHFAKLYYPDSEIVTSWATQDCITPDKIAYIGRFSAHPNYFVATGFNKWGMTTSMVAADIISAQIAGLSDEYSKIFSPDRSIFRHFSKIVVNGMTSVKGIAKYKFGRIKNSTQNLPDDSAGVFRIYGKKTGVYKKDGKIYCVDIKCPHLGCQLEWNADEKSWDCPCHGSRFDYKGNLITGPAQTDIK